MSAGRRGFLCQHLVPLPNLRTWPESHPSFNLSGLGSRSLWEGLWTGLGVAWLSVRRNANGRASVSRHKCVAQGSLFKPCGSSRSSHMNKEIEKPQRRERALRYGLKIDRVPLPLESFTIEAASRLAGLPADPAEREP